MGRDGREERVTPYTPEQQALFEASGEVTDLRRLVAFVYLTLRDEFPVTRVAEAVRASATVHDPLFQVARDRAFRLHDKPCRRLRSFLHLLGQSSLSWDAYNRTLPLRDDVCTAFTNGWVALYARYVADILTSEEDPQT